MEFIATILARLDGLFREHGFDIVERDGSYVRLSSDAVEVIIVFNQKERRPYLFIGLGCAIFEMTNDIMAEVLGSDLTIESLMFCMDKYVDSLLPDPVNTRNR